MAMTMTKWASVGSASAITGLIAAAYCLRASKVNIKPTWDTEPAEGHLSDKGWTFGMLQAAIVSANLNAKAAVWTAVSVVFSVVSAIAGTLAQ
jgi:hypothetical protein